MKILSADYVLPVSSEPISGGAVAIDDDKIVAVGIVADIMKHTQRQTYVFFRSSDLARFCK